MTFADPARNSVQARSAQHREGFFQPVLRAVEPFLFIAPGVLTVILVMLVPLAIGISYSFQNFVIHLPHMRGYTGFDHYVDMWSDRNFWLSLTNTIEWTGWSVALQFVLGLGLALLLNKPFYGRRIYQALIFLPWAVPTFLSGLNFQWLFNPLISPIPHGLAAVGILEAPTNILADPDLALYGPIVAMVWWGIPFFTITLLAALRSIPNDLYEAAAIDGANPWQRFRAITWPLLMPTITITVMLRTVWIANSPDLIFVMTGGGPASSTQILPSYLFTTAYRGLDFGYASALATVLMLLLLACALVILAMRQRLMPS